MQNLYFKNMYAWEGDCNGKSGSKKKLQRSSGSGGGSAGGWKAYTIDKKSYKNKSAMKTRNLSVDTIFNGGFCATFTSKNEGRSTCRDFAVELNLNPNTFTLQKHTTSLRKISENKGKGMHSCHVPKRTGQPYQCTSLCLVGECQHGWWCSACV